MSTPTLPSEKSSKHNLFIKEGSTDAMGCQKEIASQIIDSEADYILALKGNQGNLQEQTEDSFRFLPLKSVSEEIDAGHGRTVEKSAKSYQNRC